MPSIGGVARSLGSLAAGVSIGGRTILSLDTNPVPADWTHITKVDPEPDRQLPLVYPLYLRHTSAVSVGGSSDVTGESTEATFDLVNATGVPAFHEPSAARHVTERTREQSRFLAIPEVLNGDGKALVGTLGEGIEYAKDVLAPAAIDDAVPISLGEGIERRLSDFAASWLLKRSIFEAYIIMNLDSAAAREANVTEEGLLDPSTAKQRAMAAERHLGSEVIYLEYSGTFGGSEAVELLGAIDDGVDWSRIWYGGGLDDRENAETVMEAGADAVVVGNVFHDVAPEEAGLYDQASESLAADAAPSEVESWVETQVEPAETSAAKYLSTVTDVPDPERRAVEYLAAGVSTCLQLEQVADGLEDPDEADLRRALSEDVPGAAALTDAVGSDARPLARRLGLSLLADAFDVDLATGVDSEHLAVEL